MGRYNQCFIVLLFLLFATTQVLRAQTNLAGIYGKVVGSDNKPVFGAIITIRNESTGFTAKSQSNEKGEFLLKEVPLGTPYSIVVESMGMATQKQTGYSLSQGDLLKVSFQMQEKTENLQEIVINASSRRNKIENIGTATAVTAKDINHLPVNGRNFTTLADLSPLSSGTSLGGQLASATNFYPRQFHL